MSRKTILGRASLSFLTTDGVLDMDQILQTDPWTQIDNFVQHNFMQNVLNEFNERIALDPKLTPTDKSAGKKRATSSGRSPRKSQTDQTNGEKSPGQKKTTDGPDDGPQDKKEIAKKGNKTEGSKGKVAKNGDANGQKEEKAKRGNSGRKKTKEETDKTEGSTDTQQLEGDRKATGKKSPTVKSERRKTVRKRKGEEKEKTSETKVVEPINDKTNNSSVNNHVSKHCAGNSYVECSQCKDINNNYCELVAQSNDSKTTDAKCKRKTTGRTKEGQNPGNEEKDSNSENKETTTDEGEKSKCKKRNEKTARKTDSSASNNNISSRKDTSATKDSKNGHDETVAEKTKVKREHKTTEKVKREKRSGDKKASGISTNKKSKSKCKKQDDKTAKIGKRVVGPYFRRFSREGLFRYVSLMGNRLENLRNVCWNIVKDTYDGMREKQNGPWRNSVITSLASSKRWVICQNVRTPVPKITIVIQITLTNRLPMIPVVLTVPVPAMKLHEKKESGIHRVQEIPLEELDLSKEYEVEKTLGEGSFAKVLLTTHRATRTRVVLKAVHQELTTEKDFFREFHYSYHLSPHPNILCSYAVAFKAEKCFVFAQEYAPYGDLAGNVRAGGLSEEACKRIASQLCSALDFIHSKQLAHRDIKLENVLVFALDMSKIKLCDFGCTRREGTLVNKIRCTWLPFQPPEIYEIVKNERYACKRSADCWQFGIVLFVCLTGNPPWQTADLIQDPEYSAFQRWLKRRTTKVPPTFRRFTPRLLRYFRRTFEHKPEKRPHVTEINKYLKDSWCVNKISHSATSTLVDASEGIARRADSLLYLDTILDDQRNVDENKNKLRKLLNSYGLETTIDQKVVTKRIWEWVMQCDSNIAEPAFVGSLGTETM
ncbi:unnamed protein product [Heterotrigona itama]|uniref:Protein kinase domain-containing protein n=1 Tax=Heterotrigona itama TaxID=395501 RepID=A0A6V7HHQ0_9HYME|nr:unnamed protein product [Heterotrigona itama]